MYTPELLEAHADIPHQLLAISPYEWALPPQQQRECLEWLESRVQTLVLAGPNGTGKTWTGVLLLKMAFFKHHQTARYAFAPSVAAKWLDRMRLGQSVQLANRLIAPEVLLLDDLGQRALSDGFHDFLLTVVDERAQSRKKTIVTTNQDIEGFRETAGPALTSRLCNGAAIKITGTDKRASQ